MSFAHWGNCTPSLDSDFPLIVDSISLILFSSNVIE